MKEVPKLEKTAVSEEVKVTLPKPAEPLVKRVSSPESKPEKMNAEEVKESPLKPAEPIPEKVPKPETMVIAELESPPKPTKPLVKKVAEPETKPEKRAILEEDIVPKKGITRKPEIQI